MIKIIQVKNEEDLLLCSKLRKQVFGDEENALECLYIIDEYDKKEDTVNYLLKVDGVSVATVRFVKIDNSTVKLQRFVVLKEYRNNGYAKMLLENLERDVYNLGYKKIIMDSSQKSIGFYEKYNYKAISDVYYEDNRYRVKMEKELIG